MRVLIELAKMARTFPFGYFWSPCLRQKFSSVRTFNAYNLEDNAICASVLLGLSNERYFLANFLNISLGPPFALFLKMRVLGDLSKFAIT